MLNGRVLHVVTFELNPGVLRGDPRAVDAALISEGHPRHILEIESWRCGWDTSNRAEAVDFVVLATFASTSDLRAFQVHPDHARGKAAWSEIATWRVIDLVESPDGGQT
ncbi:Dabb family protein [Isoptericola jiangsuensis]|uniref:Dabb family protein n=1 Tax=Isoptericola jiangsuensis TaxID=548579 RepID=UPI003AB032E0